jgi:simple sugar transport system permease protein
MSRLAPSLFSLAFALLTSALVIALAGGNPLLAVQALADGAFGSAESWSEVGVKACPLLLTGLAVAIAFRAGIWNIGAEGQLVLGAIAMAWLGTGSSLPAWCALPLALLGASVAGAAWAAIAAYLKLERSVDEVIGTIMLNFIAAGLAGYLVQGPLMEAGGRYPQTDALELSMRLPRLFAAYRVHLGLVIAVVAALLAWVLLFRTVFGYEIRAAGRNREAARLAGIAIERRVLATFLLSGALAGLAGGIEVSAVTFRLYERFSPGYGFTAIAVALLGRLHPGGVAAAALLFGALEAGSNSMERVAGVSAVLVSVVQATVILCLLAVEHGWRRTAMGARASE